MRVGSDTGGTFTDLVSIDGRVVKVPSTPTDPSEAVRRGIAELTGKLAGTLQELTHGTTVATNAVLERKGAAVALYTSQGMGDVIEIARQNRPSLYDQSVHRPEPLVPRQWRMELPERRASDGSVIQALRLDSDGRALTVPSPPATVEAVAVCLLHADLDGSAERAVAAALAARGLDVTCSSEISPEMREFERTSTTVMNAYLRPICRRYLSGLSGVATEVSVMTSAGGLIDLDGAAQSPVKLLLSGPAGGVRAAAALSQANGFANAVSLDMGGTSTDVCLILDGAPEPAAEREVDNYPVRVPSLDLHAIGAGGGSIARIDPGGALVVGPESAGALPGPACYGQGGTLATVTDANLVLGRIPASGRLAGMGELDSAAAAQALHSAGVDAAGVIAVVNAGMEQALRRVTVERGVDPRQLALVAFGGAGPLHACELADALGIGTVLIPARAGVFSAVGILTAPRQQDLVRTWPTPLDHNGVQEALSQLAREAGSGLGRQAEVELGLDCRYEGQGHELTVESVGAFHDEHHRRNGYSHPRAPVEVVALRATARIAAPVGPEDLPEPIRSPALGPAVIAEDDCTIWIPPRWKAEPGAAGALVLRPETR